MIPLRGNQAARILGRMKSQHAICLIVDGLRASALGAYGAAWAPTPACDALAAESIVCDRMWCDATTLSGFYRAAWCGRHPVDKLSRCAADGPSLPALLQTAGVGTTLITDDEELAAALPADAPVTGVQLEIEQSNAATDGIQSTAIYQFFAAAVDELAPALQQQEKADGGLWWLHCRGFAGAWDAPADLRESLWADEQLEPPAFVAPPEAVACDDPDELLAYRVAYAAQMAVLDHAIGDFLAALNDLGRGDAALVLLAGARGFALGEHGWVGRQVDQLYGERLHVPCLARIPGDGRPHQRRGQLLQPQALFGTMREWFGVAAPGVQGDVPSLLAEPQPSPAEQSTAIATSENGEWALMTDEWLLRMPPCDAGDLSTPQLFAKPDDRFEANEVADRCPAEVAQLLAMAADAGLPLDPGRREE